MTKSISVVPSRIAGGFPCLLCAAAVAVTMIVPSSPASAAPIVIDDFTVNQGTFSNSNSASGTVLLFNDSDAGSFGGFTSRTLLSQYEVDSGNGVVFSGSAGAIGNGSLTLRHAKGGFPLVTGLNPVSLTRVNYSGTGVDLTGGGSNNTLRLAFSGAAISGLSPTASLVVSNGILTGVYSGPLLPTTTVGGTTAEIPFSSFTDPSVFSGATTLAFQFENAVFGGAARSAEYTLTGLSSVYVVPEPSTYAMALAGIACGGFSMWRRRKRAGNRVCFVDDRKDFRSMKSSQARHFLTSCGVLVSAVLATQLGTTASAAPIVWGGAQNIAGPSDVNTSGSLVYAYQFSNSLTGTTAVNGVPFQPFNVVTESTTATTGNVTLSATASGSVMYSYDVLTSGSAPFADLPANYQNLLSGGVISTIFDNPFGAPLNIQLGGLTAGTSYLVQWWSCTTAFLSPSQTVSLGSPNVTLDSNTTDTAGGLGQYAIGTFTASSSSTTISLQGLTMNSPPYDAPTVNALQVRAVPEPATYAMVLAGAVCSGYSMWRRRRA